MAAVTNDAKGIFLAALDRATPAERAAYLDKVCADDAVLRQRVDALLRAHDEPGTFLSEEKKPDPYATEAHAPASKDLSKVFDGRYKLLEEIGEGGMGTVWMAQQTEPVKRQVAIKLIKAGMALPAVLARFDAERQALALMDHPNIAKVYDAGMTSDGRPYFVMELVKGVSLAKYCNEQRLTPRQRLELFIPVCQAVQHAHQKGIIHRDLKPSNILVAQYDGRPVPKVIDFGVAKAAGRPLTDQTLVTGFGSIVGTLEYMSPEQAEPNQLDIDTRTDIYSLGVVLYELLTGSTPLDRKSLKQAAFAEMLRIIREVEPPKPSTRLSNSKESLPSISAQRQMEPAKLTRSVRGELDWIVMKALEKDRGRRYETANGFAMDVQRYLADETVLACPPSALYRFRKFARKNRKLLATTGAFAVLLITTTAVSTWQWREAEEQKRRAENKSIEADKNLGEARKAVDDWFIRISQTTLLEAPGLAPLRKELLEAALSYYQGLLEQARGNPELRTDLAAAYMRLSVIYVSLDRNDDAVAAILEGLELVEQLIQERPGDTEFPKRLAGFYKTSRELYQGTRAPSDPIKAVNTLQRAGEIWEQFARDNPATVEFQSDLAGIYLLLSALFQSNDLDRSLAYSVQSRTIWEKLVRAKPGVASYQEQLVLNYSENAWGLAKKGRTQESDQLFRQAVRYFENVAQEFPTELNLRQSLARVNNELAGKLRDANPAEAERIYRQTLGLLENLVAQSPANAHYRRELYTTYDKLAELLHKCERDIEAEEFDGKALAINEKLVLDFPDMADYRLALARRYSALAGRMNESRPLEAEQAYRHALAAHEKLVTDFPRVDRYKANLNESEDRLINLLRNTGRFPEAEKLCLQSIDRFEKWAAANPSVPQYQTVLAQNHTRLGLLLRNAGRAPEAENEFRKAKEVSRTHLGPQMERLKKAAEADPKNGGRWGDLAIAYCRLGQGEASLEIFKTKEHLGYGISGSAWQWFYIAMAHWHLDRKEEAYSLYYQSIDWVESAQEKRLLAVQAEAAALMDLPNPGDSSEQAWTYCQSGAALEKLGQKDKAKEVYSKAIDIYAKLLVDFPTVPVYTTKLVDLLNKTGRGKEVERVHREAISSLEKLVAVHPQMGFYRLHLAGSYHGLANYLCYEINQKAAAEEVFRESLLVRERLVADFPENRDYRFHLAHGHLGLAFIFEATARLPEAEKAYRQALMSFEKLSADFPNEPANRVELASNLQRLGILLRAASKNQEAEQAFRQAQAIWERFLVEFPTERDYLPKSNTTLDSLVNLLRETNRPQEAVQVFRQFIVRFERLAADTPHQTHYREQVANANWRLAILLETLQMLEESEKAYRQATAVWERLANDSPADDWPRHELAYSHFLLGNLLKNTNRPQEAEQAYGKSLALQEQLLAGTPTSANYKDRLAFYYVHRGNLYATSSQGNKAIADYTRAIDLNPDTLDAWLGRAQLNQPEKAVADLRQAIAKGFNNVEQMKNDPRFAPLRNREDFRKLLEELERKEKAQNDKKWEDSIVALRKAVELNPKSANAHNSLGIALTGQRKWDEAIACYMKAIQLDPKLNRAYQNLDHALNGNGRVDAAIAEWKKVIELDPKNAYPHLYLALTLQRNGRVDEAIAEWKRVNELDPKNTGAHYQLGNILKAKGDLDGAERAYREAVRLGGDRPGAAISALADLLLARGNVTEAIAGYQRIVTLNPNDASAHYRLGNALRAKGDLDEAVASYRAAAAAQEKNNLPDATSLYNAACYRARTAAVQAQVKVPDSARLAEEEVGRAMAWLTKAIAAGFADFALLQEDADLDSLRGREDFRKLVADVPPAAKAQFFILRSQWDKAAAVYAKADLLARPLNDDAFAYACLFLIRGDNEGYDRFCQGMITRAGQPKDRFEAFVLARTCAMVRNSPVDPARAVDWGKQALAGAQPAWYFHALGLAQYRAGQFDDALQSFTKADVKEWAYRELNWFGLALVHHSMGRPDEARQCLNKGIQWLERNGSPGPERPVNIHPLDWVEAQVLRREAEELLKTKRVP